MNITVRVMAASAQAQMRAMAAQIAQLQGQLAAANRTGSMGFGAAESGVALTRLGSSIQWTGRQLSTNFTVPITAAGLASAKFALQIETAQKRIYKVYGDTSMSTQQLDNETAALNKTFEALSNTFGVTQADTLDIAAGWAAAGASGIALAKATKLTMETMILGEVDAATATQALIAIQAQYGESVDELSATIDTLNMVENQTGISMGGLIEGMARAAGTARSAGVDVQHLAAFMAALVPSAGTAANAGNALKTIFSRLLSPTQEANQVLQLMGVNTADLGWKSLNAAQRLETLALKFNDLDDAQKEVVSTVVASRYQINKFDVLMRDITNTNGYYQKALNATADANANYLQRQKELNTVLTSNPRRLQIMWTILQNAMADIIQPFIPMIVSFAQSIAQMAQAFTGLPPGVQKIVVLLLALLAAIGPVAMYVGSVITLLGLLTRGFGLLSVPLGLVRGLFAGVGVQALLIAQRFLTASSVVGYLRGSMIALGALSPTLFRFVTAWMLIGKGVFAGAKVADAAIVAFVASARASLLAFQAATAASMVAFRAAIPGFMVSLTLMLSALRLVLIQMQLAMTVFFYNTLPAMLARAATLITVRFALIQSSLFAGMAAIPGIISTAGAAVYAAALRVYVMMQMALVATVPQLLGIMQTTMFVVSATIIRSQQILGAAATTAYSAIVLAWNRAGLLVAQAVWAKQMAVSRLLVAGQAAWVASTAAITRLWVAFNAGLVRIYAAAMAMMRLITLTNMKAVLAVLARFSGLIISALGGPWGIAIGLAIAAIVVFRTQLMQILRNIVAMVQNGFNQLPAAVQNPILAVVRTIRAAALAVYGWFSYLNPFAHHSPSLVEQVTAGMAVVKKQYASVGNVGAIFGKAAVDLDRFKKAITALDIDEYTSQRKDVAEFFPGLLDQFNQIVANIKDMKRVLSTVEGAMDAQQAVVDKYKKSLDAANDSLDAQQKLLDKAKDNLQSLQDAYDEHQQALQDYASTSIIGMKAADDAIFENEMAQKALQLQILKLQDAGVKSVDELSDSYKRLQGDIENINGVVGDLRNKGAGSEITDPLLDQANSMRKSAADIQKQIANNPIDALQKQLDDLSRKGQIMDLEKSLKFDALTRQIQDAANALKEMSFDDIISGIGREKQAMADLQPQIDAAKAAVDAHTKAVQELTAARDAAQASYDMENQKLTELKDAYSAVNDEISAMEDALSTLASAAQAQRDAAGAGDYLTPGAQNFINAEGGNFPEVGGFAQIGREGGAEDQSKMIDDFTKQLNDSLANSFGGFDMFQPVKDGWNSFVGWFKGAAPAAGGVLKDVFANVDFSILGIDKMVAWFQDMRDKAEKFGGALVDLFGPEVKQTIDNIKNGFSEFWDYIEPKLAGFGDLIEPAGQAFRNVWTAVSWVFAAIIALLTPTFKVMWSLFNDAFFGFVDIVKGAFGLVIDIIHDVFAIIFNLFAGDWGGLWQATKDLFTNIVVNIGTILGGAVELIWGIIKGLVTGIVDFWVWLFDVLVGHSIVPDMVNAIAAWFQNMWDWVVAKVIGMKDAVVQWFIKLVTDAATKIAELVGKVVQVASDTWTGFLNKSKEIWDTVIAFYGGLGMSAWNALQDVVTKVKQIGTDAFQGLYNIVKNIYDTYLKPLFDAFRAYFVDTIAPKINSAIESIGNAWGKLKNAAADPVRFIVDTVYNEGLRPFFNKVSGIIGGPTLPEVKLGFASGGVVPGGYSPGKDNTLAAVGSGEAIMRPEWTRAVGSDFVNEMNALAAKGGVRAVARAMSMPQYADGGVVGGTNVISKAREILTSAAKYAADVMRDPVGEFGKLLSGVTGQIASLKSTQMGALVAASGDNLISTMKGKLSGALSAILPGGTGTGSNVTGETDGSGWQWQVAQIRKAFPSIAITSTVRPGAETVSGNTSYHARGRAIDMAPSMEAFNWLLQNYGPTSKEIIYSPAGARQIKNGMPYMYSGEVRDMHFNHVHWAYDQGGWLQPGAGQYVNKTGSPEAVLTASQWTDMSTIANGVKTVTAVASRMDRAVAMMEARAATTATPAPVHNEYHFHGDLSFPNIKTGEDAETFLDNLTTLTGV